MSLISEDREDIAMAILLLKDYWDCEERRGKKQPPNHVNNLHRAYHLARILGVKAEFDHLLSRVPPVEIKVLAPYE